jgi:hypothetical protein
MQYSPFTVTIQISADPVDLTEVIYTMVESLIAQVD